jgi:hypothetical protein
VEVLPGVAPSATPTAQAHLAANGEAIGKEAAAPRSLRFGGEFEAIGSDEGPRVGNTIGPRNAPNPARPAFPRPEAGALYPPDIGSTRPGPDYSTTRPARESPTRESPELPRFQVRILQSPLFFLFWGSFSRRIGGRVPFRTTNQTPQNPPGRLRISGPGFRPEFVVIWVSI